MLPPSDRPRRQLTGGARSSRLASCVSFCALVDGLVLSAGCAASVANLLSISPCGTMGGALNVLLPVRLSRSVHRPLFFLSRLNLISLERRRFNVFSSLFVDDFCFSLRSPSQISRGRSGHLICFLFLSLPPSRPVDRHVNPAPVVGRSHVSSRRWCLF